MVIQLANFLKYRPAATDIKLVHPRPALPWRLLHQRCPHLQRMRAQPTALRAQRCSAASILPIGAGNSRLQKPAPAFPQLHGSLSYVFHVRTCSLSARSNTAHTSSTPQPRTCTHYNMEVSQSTDYFEHFAYFVSAPRAATDKTTILQSLPAPDSTETQRNNPTFDPQFKHQETGTALKSTSYFPRRT